MTFSRPLISYGDYVVFSNLVVLTLQFEARFEPVTYKMNNMDVAERNLRFSRNSETNASIYPEH